MKNNLLKGIVLLSFISLLSTFVLYNTGCFNSNNLPHNSENSKEYKTKKDVLSALNQRLKAVNFKDEILKDSIQNIRFAKFRIASSKVMIIESDEDKKNKSPLDMLNFFELDSILHLMDSMSTK